ncbi:MAG: hypothetical protein PHY93_16475 [Bacteriovorax sp.]|nr:hypothetical protein [Bacteriovorax sp.]
MKDSKICDQEFIQRFVFSGNVSSKGVIRPSAFLPQPIYPNELSVYRTRDHCQEEMWAVGDEHVGKFHNPPRQVKASAEMSAGEVRKIRNDVSSKFLELIALSVPHRNHTNIENIQTTSPKDLLVAEKLLRISKSIKR